MISNMFAVRGLAAFALLSLSVAACGGSPDTGSTDDESSAVVVSKTAHFEIFTGLESGGAEGDFGVVVISFARLP